MRHGADDTSDTHLLLLSFGDHVARHISYTFVYNLRHRRHDSLGLCAIQPLAFQPLDKVVRVEVKLIPWSRRGKRPPQELAWWPECKTEHAWFVRVSLLPPRLAKKCCFKNRLHHHNCQLKHAGVGGSLVQKASNSIKKYKKTKFSSKLEFLALLRRVPFLLLLLFTAARHLFRHKVGKVLS